MNVCVQEHGGVSVRVFQDLILNKKGDVVKVHPKAFTLNTSHPGILALAVTLAACKVRGWDQRDFPCRLGIGRIVGGKNTTLSPTSDH